MYMRLWSRQARPVFVIGSYRSATSARTWALGQHPNLFPLEETHFLYKLAVDLENLYELGTSPGERSFLGVSQHTFREFHSYFGQACNNMVMDARRRIVRYSKEAALRDKSQVSDNVKLHRGWWQPKRRWVDGTPENAHFVLPLLRLFPEARFIHILRNPRRVAASLMHFSTAGANDYAEKDAYQTWTRLVRDAALSEQALGPERVMRLMHDDLLGSPRDALAKCLAFIGEKYHPDCLMPLREKMNSSRYEDPGDCSVEAHIESDTPWIREAFQLYAQLLDDKETLEGGASAARSLLLDNLHEYRTSLLPTTNEQLSNTNFEYEKQIAELQLECRALQLRLKRIEQPLEVLEWGPSDIRAGIPFNQQPDGSSAIWISTRHALPGTQVVLGGMPLASEVHDGGNLVTAVVPAHITAGPGVLEIHLHHEEGGETSQSIAVRVMEAAGGTSSASSARTQVVEH